MKEHRVLKRGYNTGCDVVEEGGLNHVELEISYLSYLFHYTRIIQPYFFGLQKVTFLKKMWIHLCAVWLWYVIKWNIVWHNDTLSEASAIRLQQLGASAYE